MATAKKTTHDLHDTDEEVDLRERFTELQSKLLRRRAELLQHAEHERSEMNEQLTKNQGIVNDVGDASVVDTNMDYFLALADQDRRELHEINDALARMQQGHYGICQSCENPIAPERLEKLPQARLCIDCQSSIESRSRVARLHPTPKL